MASRPHTTYKKRQKELQRLEKQRDKVVRRQQKKAGLLPDSDEPSDTAELSLAEELSLEDKPLSADPMLALDASPEPKAATHDLSQ
jgi:hypothetical protein